jgi:hypothetical protein
MMPLGGIYKPDFRGERFTSTDNLPPSHSTARKERAMAYRNERFDTALLPFGKPAKFAPP